MKPQTYVLAAISVVLAGCASQQTAIQDYQAGHYRAAEDELYTLATRQGDALSARYLGYMYAYGQGGLQQPYMAASWFKLAADAGDGPSATMLGLSNPNQAHSWYLRAAQLGDPEGEAHLGFDYMYGHGVPIDYSAAMLWLQKAVAAGDDGSGEAGIGSLYQVGWGVKQDFPTALDWYQRSAQRGDREAQLLLTKVYQGGWYGIRKDDAKADDYFKQAAQLPVHDVQELQVAMREIIDAHKVYPADAIKAKQQGSVDLDFDCPFQAPTNVTVVQSSGYPSLDQAAVLAVSQSLFPPRPSYLPHARDFRIIVNFTLGSPVPAIPAPSNVTATTPTPAAAPSASPAASTH
jgi:TonB family protein